jgi:hypothetical protein
VDEYPDPFSQLTDNGLASIVYDLGNSDSCTVYNFKLADMLLIDIEFSDNTDDKFAKSNLIKILDSVKSAVVTSPCLWSSNTRSNPEFL